MAPVKFSSPVGAPVARKISFAEYRARGPIKPRPQAITTTSPIISNAASGIPTPPASKPVSPCETKASPRVKAAVRPKPKSQRSLATATTTTTISEPEEGFSLFNEPVEEPVNKAVIQANERKAHREALLARRKTDLACREIAMARSSNVIKRAAGTGASRIVNARKEFKAIDKTRASVSKRGSKKSATRVSVSKPDNKKAAASKAPKSPKSKSRLSKLSSGVWIDVETLEETSTAALEAPRHLREQQQPLTAEERANNKRRAAELERYRRETARILDAQGNTRDGRYIGIVGEGTTMGFWDERKERPQEGFPMWITQETTESAMGGIGLRRSRG